MQTRALRIARICAAVALAIIVPACKRKAPIEQELRPLPVFASSNGELNLLLVARATSIELSDLRPTAWVYEVCQRSLAVADGCPSGSSTLSPYGGVRLQVEPGDHLKIRLVNRLPATPPDSEFAQQNPSMLRSNPTNLHTHGLIVQPRQATKDDPTYGDYVYVLDYPDGKLPQDRHSGLDYSDRPLDYDIAVPRNHPAGLFWFHPHVHGLNLNQVTAGLSGVLTVGNVASYVQSPLSRSSLEVRDILLKDMQVLKNGAMMTQQESEFCVPEAFPGEPDRLGYCSEFREGALHQENGKWFFSINGQVFPKITVGLNGELWRIVNASGGRTYDLVLNDNQTSRALPFQVVAVDGISLNVNHQTSMASLNEQLGETTIPEPCSWSASRLAAPTVDMSTIVCSKSLHLMPGARAEVWVRALPGHSATFIAKQTTTGPTGDIWPEVKLAAVYFSSGNDEGAYVSVRGSAQSAFESGGIFSNRADQHGSPIPRMRRSQPNLCPLLPPGHMRRIFMGTPVNDRNSFGLGYEELDEKGLPVRGTFRDIAQFDHKTVSVCLPLGTNGITTELWELVNASGEDHNFHIHQTKFRVRSATSATGANALLDNIPVPRGSGDCDGTIGTWRKGECTTKPIRLEIPFTEAGDFVYHCHILEHEDSGMMANIRVVR